MTFRKTGTRFSGSCSRDARRHTNQQGNLSSVKYCVLTLPAMRLSMPFFSAADALLAQRPRHVIFGLAVARLALVARQIHFRRAFFGRVGIEATAFLVALALAQPVSASLAVRRA